MSKSRRLFSALALLLPLGGCAAPRQATLGLEPGMTKAETLQILGEPDSRRMRNGEDCYMYSFWRDFWNRRPGDYSDRYFACFSAERLTSFGRVGDQF